MSRCRWCDGPSALPRPSPNCRTPASPAECSARRAPSTGPPPPRPPPRPSPAPAPHVMAGSHVAGLTDRDVPDVLHRLSAMPAEANRESLKYLLECLCIFQSDVAVQTCAAHALVRIAAANRSATRSAVSREDIVTSGALKLVLLARHSYPQVEPPLPCSRPPDTTRV